MIIPEVQEILSQGTVSSAIIVGIEVSYLGFVSVSDLDSSNPQTSFSPKKEALRNSACPLPFPSQIRSDERLSPSPTFASFKQPWNSWTRESSRMSSRMVYLLVMLKRFLSPWPLSGKREGSSRRQSLSCFNLLVSFLYSLSACLSSYSYTFFVSQHRSDH